MAALQAQLTALVEAAVDRVLQQHTITTDELFLDLQQARCENHELRAALAEVQAVDESEIRRLWAVIVELETKYAYLRQEQQQQRLQNGAQALEAAAGQDAPAAATDSAAGAAQLAPQPSQAQQLEWKVARLRQQLEGAKAEVAAAQQAVQEHNVTSEAALTTAGEQVVAAQARAAAAEQRAKEADALRKVAEVARRELQKQLEQQQQVTRKDAVLPGTQGPSAATELALPPAAALPAAVVPPELAGAALTSEATVAASAALPLLLQDLRAQFEASLRVELQQQLLPLLRSEITAAVQQQQQQLSQKQLARCSLSPLMAQALAASPGQGSLPQAAAAAPLLEVGVPGAVGGACTHTSSSIMDTSEGEQGQQLVRPPPSPPPPPPVDHPPASRQQTAVPRVPEVSDSPFPPGFALSAQQQQEQEPASQQQRRRQRLLPHCAPQAAPPQHIAASPPQQQAQQAHQLVGTPSAQVAAAIAAAQDLSSRLAAERQAQQQSTARQVVVAALAPAGTATAAVVQQQRAAVPAAPPASLQPMQVAGAQWAVECPAAAAATAAPPAAAAGAAIVPIAPAPPAASAIGQAECAAEELPPWLAVAASIRVEQREAASRAQQREAAEREAAAAALEARHCQLYQWHQMVQAHADSVAGRLPKILPFAVADGADPEAIVAQAAAGQLPYCCPPCGIVFPSELLYLEHQGGQQHADRCRLMFVAYTGNVIEGNTIVKVAGCRPSVQLSVSQRAQMFCCLACSRIFKLDQFIHHLICPGHLQKCQTQLKAITSGAKRQKVS